MGNFGNVTCIQSPPLYLQNLAWCECWFIVWVIFSLKLRFFSCQRQVWACFRDEDGTSASLNTFFYSHTSNRTLQPVHTQWLAAHANVQASQAQSTKVQQSRWGLFGVTSSSNRMFSARFPIQCPSTHCLNLNWLTFFNWVIKIQFLWCW